MDKNDMISYSCFKHPSDKKTYAAGPKLPAMPVTWLYRSAAVARRISRANSDKLSCCVITMQINPNMLYI